MFHVSCLFPMHYVIMMDTQRKLLVSLRNGVSDCCVSFDMYLTAFVNGSYLGDVNMMCIYNTVNSCSAQVSRFVLTF
jgi:hypothetical protein